MGACIKEGLTMTKEDFKEVLLDKISILNDTIWERQTPKLKIMEWLKNFEYDDERLQVLFLISNFMYYGSREIRALLQAIYRDLYKYPLIQKIRIENNDTTNIDFINSEFKSQLKKTRFLGLGNPSESGSFLLYYFRQENNLAKNLFINSHEIFRRYGEDRTELRDSEINHYVFFG